MPLAVHINLVIPEFLRWSLQVPCNWNNLFYSMLSHSGTSCYMKIKQGVWIICQKQISKIAVDNLQVNVPFTITLPHLLRNPLLLTAKESLSNSHQCEKEEFPLLNLLRNKRLTEKVNCKSFQFRKWDHFSNIFKEIYSQCVPRIKMENLTPLTISCHCIAVSIAWTLSIQKLSFKVRKPLHSYAFGLFLYSFLPSAAPRYLAEERQHCGFFYGFFLSP